MRRSRVEERDAIRRAATRAERRARGVAAGVVTVGADFTGRRQRSVSRPHYLSQYSVSSPVTQVEWAGFGYGNIGVNFGFMGARQ